MQPSVDVHLVHDLPLRVVGVDVVQLTVLSLVKTARREFSKTPRPVISSAVPMMLPTSMSAAFEDGR